MVKNLQCGRPRFNPWVGKIPWRKERLPLQHSCLENPHGQRSLAGYSPWGNKESDTTERLSTSTAQHRVCSLTTLISGADENGLCTLFASVGPSPHATLFPGGMNTHLPLSPASQNLGPPIWVAPLCLNQSQVQTCTQIVVIVFQSLSRILLFATPWTAAYQAPPSLGFSRQEHWSGLPFPSPVRESGK